VPPLAESPQYLFATKSLQRDNLADLAQSAA